MEHIADLHARDALINDLRRYVGELEHRIADLETMNATATHAPLQAALNESDLAALIASAETQLPSANMPIDLLTPGGEAQWAQELVDVAASERDDFDSPLVVRISDGAFQVHPRRGNLSVAWLGPFRGPAPRLVTATLETRHKNGPQVHYHFNAVFGPMERDTLMLRARNAAERADSWTVLSPEVRQRVVSTVTAPAFDATWGLMLAVRVPDGQEIDFGWATFSEITVMASTAEGNLQKMMIS